MCAGVFITGPTRSLTSSLLFQSFSLFLLLKGSCMMVGSLNRMTYKLTLQLHTYMNITCWLAFRSATASCLQKCVTLRTTNVSTSSSLSHFVFVYFLFFLKLKSFTYNLNLISIALLFENIGRSERRYLKNNYAYIY